LQRCVKRSSRGWNGKWTQPCEADPNFYFNRKTPEGTASLRGFFV
jgi:hypothetical protein